MVTSGIIDDIETNSDKRLYTFYYRKVWSSSYLRGNSDYSVPSTHRPDVPDEQAKENKERYLCQWYEVCLNCPLERCYRDNVRDDGGKRLLKEKKLCPIEIARSKNWTPEMMLEELERIQE